MTHKPGLYLHLFNGFRTIDEQQEAETWGMDGPLIGPLQYVHVVYFCEVKFNFLSLEDALKFPGTHCYEGQTEGYILAATILKDSLDYEGVMWGDWSVFYYE